MTDHPLQQLEAAFTDLTDPRVERTKEHLLLLVGQPLPEVYSPFWGLFSALLGWAVLTQAS